MLLHGFTQTGAVWAPFTAQLSTLVPAGTEIIAPDLPGHGSASSSRLDLDQTAQSLADMIGDRAGGTEADSAGTVIGYSMGARVALHLAINHPGIVTRLVLIGANPGIDDPAERSARRAKDDALADRLEEMGVDAFLEFWLAQPLFGSLASDQADLDARRTNTTAGLASSLRLAGLGTQRSLWDHLGEIRIPTLLLTGALDAKFSAIASAMSERLPQATVMQIEGAGHAVHLEAPEATARAIGAWLSAHPE